MATCFGCRKPVVLALTDRGAMLPLNPEPSEAGALAVSVPAPGKAPRVRYLRGDDTHLTPGELRMKAHWDTSPACRVRKRGPRRPAAPKPRPTPTSPPVGRHDLTLGQLAAADLETLVKKGVL
jgi:hypothetical protein